MLRSLKRAGVNGYFAAIYSTLMPLDIVHVHFDCAGSQNLPAGGVLQATALSLWRRAHFSTWWSLFVTGAREPRVLVLQSRPYFEMQFSWQVQRFGYWIYGGDRRRALISCSES